MILQFVQIRLIESFTVYFGAMVDKHPTLGVIDERFGGVRLQTQTLRKASRDWDRRVIWVLAFSHVLLCRQNSTFGLGPSCPNGLARRSASED